MEKLFLIQIKSLAIEKEGKKALLIPMSFDKKDIKYKRKKQIHDAMIRDAMKLYPQYTNIDDSPSFSIREMSEKEYENWVETNMIMQESILGKAW